MKNFFGSMARRRATAAYVIKTPLSNRSFTVYMTIKDGLVSLLCCATCIKVFNNTGSKLYFFSQF